MVAPLGSNGLLVSLDHIEVSQAFRGPHGAYAVRAAAHDPEVETCEASIPAMPTGRQKVALMLEKGGYSHAEIAAKLGLKHRQTATQLLARARAAQKAWHAAIADFIGSS